MSNTLIRILLSQKASSNVDAAASFKTTTSCPTWNTFMATTTLTYNRRHICPATEKSDRMRNSQINKFDESKMYNTCVYDCLIPKLDENKHFCLTYSMESPDAKIHDIKDRCSVKTTLSTFTNEQLDKTTIMSK